MYYFSFDKFDIIDYYIACVKETLRSVDIDICSPSSAHNDWTLCGDIAMKKFFERLVNWYKPVFAELYKSQLVY